jgi:hypothetical protein
MCYFYSNVILCVIILSVIILSVIILSGIILSGILLSGIASVTYPDKMTLKLKIFLLTTLNILAELRHSA